MVGNGEFSWDQACSYSVCLYSVFIALCQWINLLKHIDYKTIDSCFRCMPVLFFSMNKHNGDITKPSNTGRTPLMCSKTIAEIKPLESNWLPMCLCVHVSEWTDCMHWFKVYEQLCVVVMFSHCLLFSMPPIVFLIICYSACKHI